jgi:GAF domain-containing protein/HAMP domain-containing protein/PAS domain-containing protein
MDSIQNKPSTSETQKQQNFTFLFSILFAVMLVGYSAFAVRFGNSELLWVILPVFSAVISALWFTSNNRLILGSSMLISSIGLLAILVPLVQSGLQPSFAIGALSLIGILGLFALPHQYVGRVLMTATIVAISSLLVDLFVPINRIQAESSTLPWAIALALIVLMLVYFGREFVGLDIRTKIVLGILATGGTALGVFVMFSANQTQQVTSILSKKLETSVSHLAEEQLTNKVGTLAEQANQSFNDVRQDVESLAQNWTSLQEQKQILSQGTYWDVRKQLTQLDGGQYGNPTTDISSVYVPAYLNLTDDLFTNVNTSAYLDFYAPTILESNPALLAVYAIDTQGITRYYPNINLASVLPPGFDPRTRPYYEITTSLFNPQRLTKWTIPYVDATGGGLVVTVAAPVYTGDTFNGVVAADMQLAQITEQVQTLTLGETGYAFMIDDAGRILSMPPAGYELFGLKPEEINTEEFFKETLLGVGSYELQAVVRRMAAGGNGLVIVDANGVDAYVAYSPIQSNGYSLAMVVPVAELQGAISTARSEIQRQVQTGVRILAIILILLLFLAILISLVIGQIISAPIVRLTGVANQIVGGDLNARVTVRSEDEIGTLSAAFNTMTSRLQESLQELENRVEQRTAELVSANERNERRAQQFESISQVAATISSTRDIDVLLPLITAAISTKFGFYHAGIFLLDPRKEYAVLSAANSEGGQKMLANNHRLRVGETGIVGYVTSTGRPRVALNTGQDAAFFNNPFLPDTRSEIALPLKLGEEVIGDINILTALADQVSIAIQNARQYEETRRALAESIASSRQFVQNGWQQFTKSQKISGIRHTGAKATILYGSGNGDRDESLSNREQTRARNRGVSLSMPVKLRGEVIGIVDVHSVDNRKWDQDELDIVTAIIERAAIAMENARLLAESQKRASKERTIGDISAKISAQSNIDQLLKIAAQELSRTLPGADIAIQFNRIQETE